jgi:hypothetical protein
MLVIFFDIKKIVHKELVLADQSQFRILLWLLQRLCENMRILRPELWWQKNWLLRHDNAPFHNSIFNRKFFMKSNMTVIPHPHYSPDLAPCDFSLFPWLKIKLKGHHSGTIKVIEAESQVVLNALPEHDFQAAF